MSNLPRTSDLPAVEEGFDPARVEEAFATFAERVQELETVASELREELHALRAERAAAPAPAGPDGPEVWPAERDTASFSPDWVGFVPPPLVRGLAVPRLALEAAFLLLTALFAGLADLSSTWIVVVMAAAWGLVALAEWAAAAERARWRLEEIPPPLGPDAVDETGPWDLPVIQATVVDAGPEPESQTVVAKLPEPEEPPPSATEHELAPEPGPDEAPRRRLGFRRRRAPEPAAAADPWEA